MSKARINVEKLNDIVSVKDFGAVGDGVADDTAAIQAAINSTAGPIAVYLPTGVYKVTSTITIAKDRVKLYGDGTGTRINFVPTANATCFLFDKGVGQSFQHIMRDITFYSTDTTYTKTAIKVVNIGNCLFDNVQTMFPHWFGNGSTFLHILGRDTTSFRKLLAFADKPIRISPIPAPHVAANIGIDHFHFQDCYLGNSISANPLITIDDDVLVSDVTFDGYQAWVGGSHGLYWNDTSSTQISYALTLNNVRHEQLIGTTGWAVYINRTGATLQNLNIKNMQCTTEGNGVYLRQTLYSVLDNVIYPGSQTACNIDSSNSFCQINLIAPDNAAVISVSAQRLAGKTLSGGNVIEYLSSAPSGSGLTQRLNPSATLGFSQLEPQTFTVNASSTIDFSTNAAASLVFIYGNLNVSAVMAVNGLSNSTRLLVQSDSGWFGTSAGAANYNLYWDAGTSRYKLQNNTASNATFHVQTMGRGER